MESREIKNPCPWEGGMVWAPFEGKQEVLGNENTTNAIGCVVDVEICHHFDTKEECDIWIEESRE